MLMQSVSPSIYSMGSSLAVASTAMSVESIAESAEISEPVDVNAILDWLDDAWQNDADIRNSMTEAEYLEFRNSIEQSQ